MVANDDFTRYDRAARQLQDEVPERRGGAVHHLGDERKVLRLRVVQI